LLDNLAPVGSLARFTLGARARTQLVLIWVDRNQLGRRNLTDEQRAVVIGRLYKAIKKEPHRPMKEENGENFTPFRGSHATARALAEQLGVSEKTVRNAEKFTDAVEALQKISPQAVARVLWGEVRDALVANSQTPPLFRGRVGGRERYVMEALRLQSNSLHHRLQSELPKP
jgi:hypothetical protein